MVSALHAGSGFPPCCVEGTRGRHQRFCCELRPPESAGELDEVVVSADNLQAHYERLGSSNFTGDHGFSHTHRRVQPIVWLAEARPSI
ncbi:MAG: hypothetical protein GVY12_11950 [Bacteroidetes bacterium]|nr:hypothetical protein [Bacteroidota bacterium]